MVPPDGALLALLPFGLALLGASSLAAVASLFVRLRRARELERMQLLVSIVAAAVAVVVFVVALQAPVLRVLEVVGWPLIPAAAGIAILRYRLYDLEPVLGRALLYGAMSVGVAIVYALVAGFLSLWVVERAATVRTLAAVVIATLTFAPMRDRLQRVVDRVVYGERHDPHAALSRLGERLQATMAPDVVLPAPRRWAGTVLAGTFSGMSKPWMIDEIAYAGSEHLDPAFVAGYDRKQGAVPDDAAAVDLAELQRHGLGTNATVVDLATGTGRFAVAAAEHCRRVVAVDVSPAMLRLAQDRAAAAGCSNVEFVQAGFLSYDHHGSMADAVYTRNALHQLPDFWKVIALSRIARVLRSGGLLRLRDLIYDFQPDEADDVFDGWLARAVADPALGYTSEDFAEHIRSEYSTFRWLLEPMLHAAGFDIVDVDFRDRLYGAYSCVKR